MNDSVFGELQDDDSGFYVNRQFNYFDDFLPCEADYEDDSEIRSNLIEEVGPELGALLDVPIDEIDPDQLPESVLNSPVGFLIKHGDRLQMAMQDMFGDGDDDEQEDAESAEASRLAALGILPVTIETLESDEPTDAQRSAYQFFTDNEESVTAAVLDAILEYYQFVRDEDPNWFDDSDCPAIDSTSDLAGMIEFAGLVVTPFERDGSALVGFRFFCDWDIDRALGVLMHRDRILEVGDNESAFEPHANSVWRRIKPDIVQLATQLVASVEATKDRAFEALPPTEKLTYALINRDDAEIERLLGAGADIDAAVYPAMFVAIDEPSADMVRRILELGGTPHVEFEGQSALEYANERFESVSRARQFFDDLGDELIEEIDGPKSSFFEDAEEHFDDLDAIVQILAEATES